MSQSQIQSNQVVLDTALSELGSSARDALDTILGKVNTSASVPGKLTAAGLVVTIGSTTITGPDNRLKSLPGLNGVNVGGLSGTLTFANSGLACTGTGDVQNVTFPTMTAGYYVRAGFEVRNDKKIYCVFGNQASTLAAASMPVPTGIPLGVVNLHDLGGVTQAIAAGDVIQFGSGSGGGSGSGIGGINYVDNYTGDTTINGWITYNNSGAAPTTGAGGSPTLTLTKDTTNPLRGLGSFLITHPASNCQGDGISCDLTTFDAIDKGALIYISFEFSASANYANDLSVFIYDKTGTALIPLNSTVTVSGLTGKYVGTFVSSSTSSSYRLILHTTTVAALAWTMDIDNVIVGPRSYDTELGDFSFRPYKVAGGIVYLKGGAIQLSNGDCLVSGSSTTEENSKSDISLNLATIATSSGITPTNNTTYWLYIDRILLPTAVNLTSASNPSLVGRKVINVYNESHFDLFATSPDVINSSRYIEVGFVHYQSGAWSTLPGFTPSRTHNLLSNYFNPPQVFKDITTNTTGIKTLNHLLAGVPQQVQLYFYDNSLSARQPLDASSYIQNVTTSQITLDATGFTFDSGDYIEVEATYFSASGSLIVTPSTQFQTGWYADTVTTTVAHGRSDMEDIKGLVVQEWDITAGRRRNIPVESLVEDFDATNLYFNWSGLTPSSTLKYRVTTGGNALPQAIPDYIGGYTKYVGSGPGNFGTLALALAASAAGDSILVNRSYSISAAETISLSDIKVTFMPGVYITQTAAAKGLIISGSNVRVDNPGYIFTVAGTVPAGIEISGNDCFVEKTSIVANNAGLTITAGINMTAASNRNFVNVNLKKTAGAITANYADAGTNNECLNRG